MFTRLSSRLGLLVAFAALAGACGTSVNNLTGEHSPTTAALLPTAAVAVQSPRPTASSQAATARVTSTAERPVARPTPTATLTSPIGASAPVIAIPSAMPRIPALDSSDSLALQPATATTQVLAVGDPLPTRFRPALAEVEQQIRQIRGLDVLQPITQRLGTSADLRRRTIHDFEQEYSRAQAERQSLLHWLLRIGQRDTDLYTIQVDLYSSNIAAYYDYEQDQVFLRSDGGEIGPWERSIYAHEVVHALQDQHFNLSLLLDESLGADERMARRALVEGDAMLADGTFYWQHLSDADREAIALLAEELDTSVRERTPPFVLEAFDFPYTAGVDFALALWRKDRWRSIDAALADPPASTEQILHPEKYLSTPRDEPLAVEATDLQPALGVDWSETLSDTLGEFDLRSMLSANGVLAPEQGAAGWGGARYRLWQNGADGLLLVATRWDSQLDAGEFALGLLQALAGADTAGELFIEDGRYTAFVEQGDQVILISGSDRSAVERALEQIRE